jgi:hypothetical protein
MSTITDLHQVAGSELSAVCFVRDYIELHFDGPTLRILASPILIDGENRWEFPQDGSRDALCGLIGSVVVSAAEQPDSLVLEFDGGAVLKVPKASRGAGPEIAHFVPMREGRPDAASMTTWENLISTHDDSAGLL